MRDVLGEGSLEGGAAGDLPHPGVRQVQELLDFFFFYPKYLFTFISAKMRMRMRMRRHLSGEALEVDLVELGGSHQHGLLREVHARSRLENKYS